MAEYLAPGVYVEEVSYRSKSIEGAATSTTAFAGRTHTGPVFFEGGPTTSEPRLITSFTEFESVYGGLGTFGDETAFVAHAARMFFANGGVRLYVSRVVGAGAKRATLAAGGVTWSARWPGKFEQLDVKLELVRGRVIDSAVATSLPIGTLLEVHDDDREPVEQDPLDPKKLVPRPLQQALAIVQMKDGKPTLLDDADGAFPALAGTKVLRLLELRVTVDAGPERRQVFGPLGVHGSNLRWIGRILDRDQPEDENAIVEITLPGPAPQTATDAIAFVRALTSNAALTTFKLANGNDGNPITPDDLAGAAADPDDPKKKATGLAALAEIDDIAIVAAPGASSIGDGTDGVDRLIQHAEQCRYRIAVVDAPKDQSLNGVRKFRGRFDTKYGALYHPWLEILDPLDRPGTGTPQRRISIPPSGAVCGIYARNDIERGVHKAPANEIVRGLSKFEVNINKPRQEVLNPEGVNALRFFEGRGHRVWGARTMSSDPEWKYVNVRRLFIYLEHSIDKSTQYAVFEPNNERLWQSIKQSVEDFLFVQWKNGALLGTKPEDAYFVRCDRTTMAQNDLDNGRLICLVGVAPVMPAEFVVFRVGQFTANARN